MSCPTPSCPTPTCPAPTCPTPICPKLTCPKQSIVNGNKDCLYDANGKSAIVTSSGRTVIANCEDGWLVIAHRFNGKVAFHNRTLNEYKKGFDTSQGKYKKEFDTEGEYFIGFEAILTILKWRTYKMRFDLVGWNNSNAHPWVAKYSSFSMGEESDNFKLTLRGFNSTGSSTIKDSITKISNPKLNKGTPGPLLFREMTYYVRYKYKGKSDDRRYKYKGKRSILYGVSECSDMQRSSWWYSYYIRTANRPELCGDANLFSSYPVDGKCDKERACMFWSKHKHEWMTSLWGWEINYLKEMKMKIKPST
ncbi:unnamed protein product [Owenia fusiformis]|uniref:Fibrinogen C-terminal domain-containing protein n=1 Tax=Owenia fusiformis TaxID=6347 RepID=A0A8S4PJG2_OWEFU|nr:unnamed protein product [Owenia fusiformis]